jgi:hypothetical protein
MGISKAAATGMIPVFKKIASSAIPGSWPSMPAINQVSPYIVIGRIGLFMGDANRDFTGR